MGDVKEGYHKPDSMKDQLTGIYNRQGFYKFTQRLLDQNPTLQFCLIYFNIRKFKVVNDLFGWDTGDKILIRFAQSLKEELGDEVAVYGRLEQDNFICCVREKVIQRGAWMKLGDINYTAEDCEYHFFSCCGLYRITNTELSVSNMVDKARVAMESAKSSYMTPYAWYDESMWGSIIEEQRMNSDFRKAVSEKQFKVYYQPVCRAGDGVMVSAEALVRWQHPEKGLISPGLFIPIFEKNGFISILDRYVWDEVCRMQAERLKQGRTTVPVSINVSRVEFYNQNLCEDIRDIVQRHGIPANLIKIEITESAYSDNPHQVQEAVKKLHEYGFLLMMDDFGSGYSSLNILKDLPIDVLKVDMKFLDNFEKSQKAPIILEAVVRMAKWMKLQVVAEGVETKKEWDYLKSVECDLLQGYYFYKPMPEEAFSSLLGQVETGEDVLRENDSLDSDDVILDVFSHGDSRESMLFYSMLGGMGILEMTENGLEIIQVNKGYYEAIYRSADNMTKEINVMNKRVKEPECSILMEKCRLSKEKDCVQQTQLHYEREDGVYVWLNVKVRYLGSRGKRSLFYFALDNIDEIKKVEQENYLYDYSAALMKVFDKVYRLDYTTGMAEVLHTNGTDEMQVREKYYFIDFFDRFEEHIKIADGEKISDKIRTKEALDAELRKSKNGSFSVNYRVDVETVKVHEVSALFFKVELHDGREEYLCCLKTSI